MAGDDPCESPVLCTCTEHVRTDVSVEAIREDIVKCVSDFINEHDVMKSLGFQLEACATNEEEGGGCLCLRSTKDEARPVAVVLPAGVVDRFKGAINRSPCNNAELQKVAQAAVNAVTGHFISPLILESKDNGSTVVQKQTIKKLRDQCIEKVKALQVRTRRSSGA